jgi:ABC-type glycerol-3-phosphate transport system permease component
MQNSLPSTFKKLIDSERAVALILGIVFLVVGIAGFIPGFIQFPGDAPVTGVYVPRLSFSDGYGHVFGLFPTNFLHNAIHIVVGVLGIAAATSFSGSLVYNRGFAVVYTLIVLMGLLPATNTTFGLMPIYGNNVWFNALTALIAGYVGFFKPAEVEKMTSSNA